MHFLYILLHILCNPIQILAKAHVHHGHTGVHARRHRPRRQTKQTAVQHGRTAGVAVASAGCPRIVHANLCPFDQQILVVGEARGTIDIRQRMDGQELQLFGQTASELRVENI